ncbi:hypothetical protein ACOSP7_030778 [Xanthoceras sorbifolium]
MQCQTRAGQGSRTYLPVIPSHRSSLWAAIVFFWAVFELLAVAPIRPPDRRLRSASRDRVCPGSSYSDPLSVCERWCWCDRIGEAVPRMGCLLLSSLLCGCCFVGGGVAEFGCGELIQAGAG